MLLTGATGFLGRSVQKQLEGKCLSVIPVSRKLGLDLTDEVCTTSFFEKHDPDIVIHLAGRVGGIGANMAHPGSFFYENMKMGLSVIHAANKLGARVIVTGTVCSYPKDCPVPFKEDDLWNGFPEPTNAPYGIAKKAMLVMLQGYRKEYGASFGYLMPSNLYGPYDNFNEKQSHIVPALIKRFVAAKDAGLSEVTCWGTGKVTRSFLYVDDAAEAIVRAADVLDSDLPVNLGGGEEISIHDLAKFVAKAVGYEGAINWDPSKPDGQPRRHIDGSRAKELLGWEPKTSFADGIKRTLDWYLSSLK